MVFGEFVNLTPQELWIAFAEAIQETVGHQRSVQPQQEPLRDWEMEQLELRINKIFYDWSVINGK